MRRAAAVDSNQSAIVKALRDCHQRVFVTSMVGRGFPDVVVGRNGFNYFLEVKDPTKPRRDQRLTEDEELFHKTWPGQICVVKSIEEALTAIGLGCHDG